MFVVVWPCYWPEASHNGTRLKAEGHYGCLKDYCLGLQSTLLTVFIKILISRYLKDIYELYVIIIVMHECLTRARLC